MGERHRAHVPVRHEAKHGATSRANKPVPAFLENIQQSNRDRALLLQQLLARRRETKETDEPKSFGNKELPAFKHKEAIINVVERFKASIIGGETGSGKSTQVPQFLYEAGFDKVYVMVPRRLAADKLFDRLREEMSEHLSDEELNEAIGVMHGERSQTHENNRIVIMTPNTYLRAADDIEGQHADKKVAVIADEMHEANVYTEIAAGIGLRAAEKYDDWHFVAMSATHNADVLQRPLGRVNGGDVPSVSIEGRPHDMTYEERSEETAWSVYANECQDDKVSMIFTSGKAELGHIIAKTRAQLDAQVPGSSNKVVFRKLHAELTEYEIEHVGDPVPDGYRLVIVSTPAGMSSITIPGCSCVIADGTINRGDVDDDDVEGLSREYLSQAGIIQEFGRAGRDVPGGRGFLVKPVMIEEDKILDSGNEVEVLAMPYKPFAEREDFEPPEIYHTNLSGVVLTTANLNENFSDVNEYLAHRLKPSAITKANQALTRLGALDEGLQITSTGRLMSKFQVRPELSRGIAESLQSNRSLLHMARMAIISAAVASGGVQDFSPQSTKRWKALLDVETNDDMLAQLDIVTALPDDDSAKFLPFLRDYELNYKRTRQTQKVARKIMGTLGIIPENVVHGPVEYKELQLLRDDLTAGMIDNIYEYVRTDKGSSYYRNIHADDPQKQRRFSERSIADDKTKYVAAFARWFTRFNRTGERVKHVVVEQIMPVNINIVGSYAQKADILSSKHVEFARMGKVTQDKVQPMFGTIPVGAPQFAPLDQVIPKAAQDFMVDNILKDQGYNQKALREDAAEIEHYLRSIPMETINELRLNKSSDNDTFITQDYVTKLIRLYAERTDSELEIDRLIGNHIYKENIGVEHYFDNETRKWLQKCSPVELQIGEFYYKVSYATDTNRTPYVTIATRENDRLAELCKPENAADLVLPDGRQVLVQIMRNGKKQRILPSEL